MYYVIGGVAVVVLALFVMMFPDLIRYMKIRSM
ncbi:MAG: DUF6893 family small protein [Candidatus Acidiferrum sp.]